MTDPSTPFGHAMISDYQLGAESFRNRLQEWKQAIPSEWVFWNHWMRTRGGQWPEDFQRRFDLEAQVDPWIAAALQLLGQEGPVSILDVGSGPVPSTGYKLAGTTLRITAIDPLASLYRDLMALHGLAPPVSPIFAPAEDLSVFFNENSFDLVHCRNALDHSFDPLRGITEMLSVVRVGGLVLLRHHRNEAEHGKYEGFHQHNIDCCDGRFIIWNKDLTADIGDLLSGVAEVSCTMSAHVDVEIRKLVNIDETRQSLKHRIRQYAEATIDAAAQSAVGPLTEKPSADF